MPCKKILLATDFSPASQAALEFATALASQWKAPLVIVHVEEPPSAVANEYMFVAGGYSPDPELRKMLAAVVPDDPTVRYEHRALRGAAAEEITRFADEEHVDLIVLGTHGRTGITRLLMGSVAEAVVRKARCPVLTLKAHIAEPES